MKFTRKEFLLSLIMSTTAFLSGCQKAGQDPDPQQQDPYLVSHTTIRTFTRDQMAQQVQQINPALSFLVRYGIKVHKIVYNTKHPDGTAIKASGVLLVPDAPTALPMVSQQHGTISSDADAPSNFGPNSDAAYAGTLFASLGFILICPDYIGYGESKNLPHTYEHREGLATASLDMIRAAKEFMKETGVKTDDRLFLTGYSEGGFATMALHKKIEEEFPAEFNLRGSSIGSGAYDKPAFMKYIINEKTHGISSYNRLYLWTMLTYNDLYKLNRPMSYYLKEPYATQVQEKGRNVDINVSISDIFTDSFRKAVNDGTDKGFLDAVKDNDIHDWAPKARMRLYHGDADNLVFPFNTTNTVEAMKKRGVTNVEVFMLKGRNHATAVSDYLLGTFEMFSSVQ
ncbi:alpha/beta hydrolase family protein [Larkinella soli]|uniref:alpha/beta hydrolase family protein n=1 Tax=Larkinella soli TaxID=1770527 RepID=UPI000FFB0ED5|nr:lipase family protein [Larkinella soli]